MGASSKNKSKKGPKGKKQRAKAKLDRQWGEENIVDSESRRNRKSTRPQRDDRDQDTVEKVDKTNSSKEYSFPSQSFPEDGIQESSSDESTNDNKEGFSALMSSIKSGKKGLSHIDTEDENSSSDEDITLEDDNDAESDIEDDNSDRILSSLVPTEPFSDRFTHHPLAEDEKAMELHLLKNGNEKTVKLDPGLLPSPYDCDNCEIQISDIIASKFQISSNEGINSKQHWKRMSKIIYQTHFREVLHQQSFLSRRQFDSTQSILFPFLSCYADMLITNIDSKRSRDSTQAIAILHILNHVITNRGRISKHDRCLKELEKQSDDDVDNDIWRRDQGFTRPTVLVLLPTRQSCYEFVQMMQSNLGSSIVENVERFETEYGPPQVLEAEERLKDEEKRLRRLKVVQQKGSEWNDLFGDDANDDDDFKIGITLFATKSSKQKKKASKDTSIGSERNYTIKLFSDFYKSDIILASPLGLKMVTSKSSGEDNNDDEDDTNSEPNKADFLSSIEIFMVTRADVLSMQNWDHVNDVLSSINQQPQKVTNYTDFSRVRQYLLAGHAAYWRQFICLSAYSEPCILSTVKRYSKSLSGLVRFRKRYTEVDASISDVILPAQRQVFYRFPCSSFASQSEDRIRYFVENLLPRLIQNKQKNTMIFVASYFDYVSLRNILQKKGTIEFASITEYTRTSEVSRNKAYFLKGYVPVLLYTGRAHFFLRHAIKGILNLIFLGLPENASFYPEHVNRLKEGVVTSNAHTDVTESSCVSLFCKFDSHALERIVGTKNCLHMMKDAKQTFVFSS